MIDTLRREVATQFQLSEEELQREGIKAFLQDRLHLFEVTMQERFSYHWERSGNS